MSETLDLALAEDIVSRLIRAIFVWQLGHKGVPSLIKLPEAEYDELMINSMKRDAIIDNGYYEEGKFKFREIEVVRSTRNFIEFEE